MTTTHDTMIRRGTMAAAGLALAALPAATASAADGAAFYKGKNVTYVVATAAGGGYDFYGRLVAKFMEKNLPGSTFVVRNMPGAGHIIGANHIANAKADGLTIGLFNTGLIFTQLLNKPGVKFDLARMTWIGKAASDPRVVMVRANSPIKTLQDMTTSKSVINFSSSGVGSSGYNDTMMLSKVLNWNMKVVLGYDGNDAELAMRRGEIEAQVGSLSSAELFVKNGYGRIIVQIGGKPATDAPMLADVVTDKNAKAIAALIGSQADLARFTAGPGGIPADRTEALIAAYRKSMEDKELQAQAEKGGRPIDPAYGKDVERAVKAALDQPPEVVKLVAEILDAKAPSTRVETKLSSVSPDGREISFAHAGQDVKSKVSGSRTKITVAGKPAKRTALKAGMACVVDYTPGADNEPKTIDCK